MIYLQFIVQGTVKRGRRRQREEKSGRQTTGTWRTPGLELAKSQRAVENRDKWRILVVKSSVVPERPFVRDR